MWRQREQCVKIRLLDLREKKCYGVVGYVQCKTTTLRWNTRTRKLCWARCAARCAPEERSPPRSDCDDRNLKPSSTFVSGLLRIFLDFPKVWARRAKLRCVICHLSRTEPEFDPTWRAMITTRSSCWSWWSGRTTAGALTVARPVSNAPLSGLCCWNSDSDGILLTGVAGTLSGHRSVQFFGCWLFCKYRINLKRRDFKRSLPVTPPLLQATFVIMRANKCVFFLPPIVENSLERFGFSDWNSGSC